MVGVPKSHLSFALSTNINVRSHRNMRVEQQDRPSVGTRVSCITLEIRDSIAVGRDKSGCVISDAIARAK